MDRDGKGENSDLSKVTAFVPPLHGSIYVHVCLTDFSSASCVTWRLTSKVSSTAGRYGLYLVSYFKLHYHIVI